jgi:hypothetical protein
MSDLDARAFIRRPQGFVPADVMSQDMLDAIPIGKEVLLSIRKPRNPSHHRKLFALLKVTIDQTDRWADTTVLLEDLKLATGLFTTRISAFTGMPYPAAASISFASMPQDRFEEWYRKATAVLSEHLGTDVETLSAEVAALAATTGRPA